MLSAVAVNCVWLLCLLASVKTVGLGENKTTHNNGTVIIPLSQGTDHSVSDEEIYT